VEIVRKLLQTESAWNPKVIIGRLVVRVLPDSAIHALQKHYYAYILKHRLGVPEHDRALAGYLVAEGDSAVDVGASIGGYTRFFSEKVGSTGYVYSFEPNPATFDFLAHSIAVLGLQNVKVFNVAVSNAQGSAELKIPRYRWGSECHYDARIDGPIKPEWRSVSVTTGTLDSLLGNQSVSFIKCDANFHELSVLRGSKELIARCHPAMLIEVNPDPDNSATTAHETFALLREAGYGVYWLDGEKLRRRRTGEKSQNYFFLMPTHVSHLSRLGFVHAETEDSVAGIDPGVPVPTVTMELRTRN
jgi:FkbM family methyltransferase